MPKPGSSGLVFLKGLWIGAAIVLAVAGGARTQTSGPAIKVPLTVDYAILSEALKRRVYTQAGRAPLWNGMDRCQFFFAENPVFSRTNDRVGLETDANLSLGVALGSQCISPIAWSGIIAAETAPYISGHFLKFRITDINLLNPQHEKTLIASKGFDLVKQHFIPRLETFEFDLNPATQQLTQLAEAASPPVVAQRVKTTLASLRVLPEVDARDEGIRVTIELTMPAMPTASPALAPAPLTAAELTAFEQELDQWDAFLVFAVKQLGGVNRDQRFRQGLLDILLDSRHRLVDALANPRSGGPDPVRMLFADEWQRLGGLIRKAARSGELGDRSLEFLSFISAGDALFALDQAAPALGMHISSDDLRRLAHIMAPGAKGNPLAFSFAEDPELRKLFGLGNPTELAAPAPTAAPRAAPAGPASATASPPTPRPATPAPTSLYPAPAASTSGDAHVMKSPPARFPTPGPLSNDSSPLLRWLGLLTEPGSAYGAQEPVETARNLQHAGDKLRRTAVDSDNGQQYRADIDQLLVLTSLAQMDQANLALRYRDLYGPLVKAVAWQESCWRQFVRKGKKVVYLESSTHDVGLMQVNKYVWRGFYNISKLEWDILYNSSAGAEILAGMLNRVGKRRDAMTPGKPDELARSVYAAYNGGPGAYRRWRGYESPLARHIDRSFWKKYQAIRRGQEIDILSCAAEWGKVIHD